MHTYHVLCEARLLPIVHDDDLVPVLGHLRKAEGAAEVDQVEDVLVRGRARNRDRGGAEVDFVEDVLQVVGWQGRGEGR